MCIPFFSHLCSFFFSTDSLKKTHSSFSRPIVKKNYVPLRLIICNIGSASYPRQGFNFPLSPLCITNTNTIKCDYDFDR